MSEFFSLIIVLLIGILSILICGGLFLTVLIIGIPLCLGFIRLVFIIALVYVIVDSVKSCFKRRK